MRGWLHAQLKIDTSLAVYFADPHSPWQRGTNENTNGLLRQYFPKGTDLSRWSRNEIGAVAASLNARPRKTLGWKTPAEALDEHLHSLQQAGVATTDRARSVPVHGLRANAGQPRADRIHGQSRGPAAITVPWSRFRPAAEERSGPPALGQPRAAAAGHHHLDRADLPPPAPATAWPPDAHRIRDNQPGRTRGLNYPAPSQLKRGQPRISARGGRQKQRQGDLTPCHF